MEVNDGEVTDGSPTASFLFWSASSSKFGNVARSNWKGSVERS